MMTDAGVLPVLVGDEPWYCKQTADEELSEHGEYRQRAAGLGGHQAAAGLGLKRNHKEVPQPRIRVLGSLLTAECLSLIFMAFRRSLLLL